MQPSARISTAAREIAENAPAVAAALEELCRQHPLLRFDGPLFGTLRAMIYSARWDKAQMGGLTPSPVELPRAEVVERLGRLRDGGHGGLWQAVWKSCRSIGDRIIDPAVQRSPGTARAYEAARDFARQTLAWVERCMAASRETRKRRLRVLAGARRGPARRVKRRGHLRLVAS